MFSNSGRSNISRCKKTFAHDMFGTMLSSFTNQKKNENVFRILLTFSPALQIGHAWDFEIPTEQTTKGQARHKPPEGQARGQPAREKQGTNYQGRSKRQNTNHSVTCKRHTTKHEESAQRKCKSQSQKRWNKFDHEIGGRNGGNTFVSPFRS